MTALLRLWPVWLLLILGGLTGLVAAKTAEEGRLRDTIASQADCLAAVAGPMLATSASACSPEVAAVHATARRSEACDAALLAGELFAQRAACSTEVKTLAAHREAESRRADSLAEILAQERADRSLAIVRAETRARTETERKLRAEAALSSAPRRGDRLVLDAERLRQLGGAGDPAEP